MEAEDLERLRRQPREALLQIVEAPVGLRAMLHCRTRFQRIEQHLTLDLTTRVLLAPRHPRSVSCDAQQVTAQIPLEIDAMQDLESFEKNILSQVVGGRRIRRQSRQI